MTEPPRRASEAPARSPGERARERLPALGAAIGDAAYLTPLRRFNRAIEFPIFFSDWTEPWAARPTMLASGDGDPLLAAQRMALLSLSLRNAW